MLCKYSKYMHFRSDEIINLTLKFNEGYRYFNNRICIIKMISLNLEYYNLVNVDMHAEQNQKYSHLKFSLNKLFYHVISVNLHKIHRLKAW